MTAKDVNEITEAYGKFSLRLIEPAMFGATFDLVVSDYNKFWNDSLSTNMLASNNCLCDRNVFANSVNTFSKMINHFFLIS